MHSEIHRDTHTTVRHGSWEDHGDTRTTVRHGSCHSRLKFRQEGASIGLEVAGRFAGRCNELDQKNSVLDFINRAAANRLGTLKAQSS